MSHYWNKCLSDLPEDVWGWLRDADGKSNFEVKAPVPEISASADAVRHWSLRLGQHRQDTVGIADIKKHAF